MSLLLTLSALLLPGDPASAQTGQPAAGKTAEPMVPDLDSLKIGGLRIGAPPVDVSGTSGGLPFQISNTSGSSSTNATSEHGEFVAAPVPFLSPTIGFGIAGGVGYIYRPSGDGNSDPWVTGAGGFYSENGSWGAGAGHKMSLADDRWRVLALSGYANLRYDFFGVGQTAGNNGRFVSLSQNMAGGLAEGLYRVSGSFYAGLRYSFARVTTGYEGSTLPPLLNNLLQGRQVDAVLSAPALRWQWDTRDSQFNPSRGWLVDGEAALFDPAFGSDFAFQTFSLTVNHYWRLADRQVLAFSGHGRFSFGNVPFFALSSFGAKNQLRGYAVGRYQDRMLLAGQAEYRFQATRRLGLVAFAGVGAVAPDLEGFAHAKALPSGGFGVRYLIAPKNKVNFRVDVAWGKDGHAIYLGVGEAF